MTPQVRCYRFCSKCGHLVSEVWFGENGDTYPASFETLGLVTQRRLVGSLTHDYGRNGVGGSTKETTSIVGGMDCLHRLLVGG